MRASANFFYTFCNFNMVTYQISKCFIIFSFD